MDAEAEHGWPPDLPPGGAEILDARVARLDQATEYAADHRGLGEDLKRAIAHWVSAGGPPPWEDQ